jgi:hypothetical protein
MNLFLCLLLHKHIKRLLQNQNLYVYNLLFQLSNQTIIDITDYDYQQQTS